MRGRALIISALVFFCALMCCTLLVLGIPQGAMILLCMLLIVVMAIAMGIDYYMQSRYWKALEQASESIDNINQYIGLVPEPDFPEGASASASIDRLLEVARKNLETLQSESDAHSTYIEQWIHEVKTPIAASKLVLERFHGQEGDALKKELERIEGLVDQALFVARSSTLSRDYLIREVNLSLAAKEACKSNMQLLTDKGVALKFDIDPEVIVLADKIWVSFIISQIIVNSVKYDSSEISFTLTVDEGNGSSKATVLEIRDNGCGIPAEDVPRVFDRGFTGQTGRSHGAATGMGLYLCARMCAQMKMGISLSSEVGKGTMVRLTFPHDDQIRILRANLT